MLPRLGETAFQGVTISKKLGCYSGNQKKYKHINCTLIYKPIPNSIPVSFQYQYHYTFLLRSDALGDWGDAACVKYHPEFGPHNKQTEICQIPPVQNVVPTSMVESIQRVFY